MMPTTQLYLGVIQKMLLLKSLANAAHLAKPIKQLSQGKAKVRGLVDE